MENKKEFLKRINKLGGSICLWAGSFDSPSSKIYGDHVGGNYFIGNAIFGTPWGTRTGKLLLDYLLGSKTKSNKAYLRLRNIENESLIAEHERMIKRHNNDSREKTSQRRGYIYLLKSRDIYKIGKTLNLRDRSKRYRAENPFGTRVLFQKEVDNYTNVERGLLEKFKEKRFSGEWFKLDEDDILWIKQNT